MTAQTSSETDLRSENISAVVTGFALQEMKMMQLCAVTRSSSNVETYYQETATDLTGGTGSAIKGVPRFADFPYGEVSWTKKSTSQIKHAMEGVISWEDSLMDNVDVIARTLLRISRGIAKSVDTLIWDTASESRAVSLINSVTISAGSEWNSAVLANRDPVKDILNAIKEIQTDNYDPLNGNGYLLLNPANYTSLISNSKVIQNPTFKAADIVANGVVGQICGLKIIVSQVVTTDYAAVVIGKEALTCKEVQGLTVQTILDPGIKYTIRGWTMNTIQLVNPEAVCLIINTDA